LLLDGSANPHSNTDAPTILESSPTLAPFQHVRFCRRYPSDCQATSEQSQLIDLNEQSSALLEGVNRKINASIIPTSRSCGSNLEDAWTIAPDMGDCNDYAVTKRHELLRSGLPSNALRLSVVKTSTGIGHLLLVVATTKGDLVLDNLNNSVRAWQLTDYQWLKIQSTRDPHYWSEIKSAPAEPMLSQTKPIN
jgi:predicted transglutaminase-like cysteine proteinase